GMQRGKSIYFGRNWQKMLLWRLMKEERAALTSMNISLTESMRVYVEEQIASGNYATPSEYFRELIREDKKGREQERLEKLLLEGLESGPATPMTKADWDAIKQRGLQ